MRCASGRLRAVPERRTHLPHLIVTGRSSTEVYRPSGGGGNPKIKPVEARSHGPARKAEVEAAFVDDDALRDWSDSSLFAAELRSLGSILRIEGWSSEFELQLKS